ncbi:type II toxin-antitoxin system HicB family antitoxin [Stappia sp. ES.058]|uniref:type II toxin-antitoxin system HicB family antitoxin n=1 Tax=Stappia sp. ES.058 TaxID=1881061 RepID=UPI000879B10B|nr:type II toxin-antitoxin system HicB family antitoxin [Stappia sp. ES.058]SDU26344.1 Predicted nuclease of the RNAse H fold, HicB family [Stappia sp. ES.058]
MKTLRYKSYQAAVEFDDGALFVRVLHIDDVLIAECDSASETQSVFEDLIDTYLKDCEEVGKEPDKPFSGTFNVRVRPELHRKAAMLAADNGIKLNAWVTQAIEEKVARISTARRPDVLYREVTKLLEATHRQERFWRTTAVAKRLTSEAPAVVERLSDLVSSPAGRPIVLSPSSDVWRRN